MNKIFTQIALGMVCLFASVTSNAQIDEKFDASLPTGSCWEFVNLQKPQGNQNGPNAQSLTTKSNRNNTLRTPFIQIPAYGLIKFDYITSNGSTLISFTVSIINEDGIKTQIAENINISSNKWQTFEVPVVEGGLYRVEINFTNTGNAEGNTYANIDNLFITGDVSTKPCSAPEAGAIALPIKFVSFSGNAQNTKAELVWNVAENETGSQFDVQKSIDGKNFEALATVFTTTASGNASYKISDAAFNTNGTYYRIKAINKDQSSSFSKIVFIKGNTTVDNKITLMQNPVQSSLNFSFTSAGEEANELNIYNLAGIKVYSQKLTARKGTNSFSLNLDGKLVRGNYILTVNSTTAQRSIQLIKQ